MKLNLSMQARFFSSLAGLGLALCALSMASPALAQGDVTAEIKYPYASLRAEAVREVPRDTVRITLAADIRDSEQAEVATSLSRSADSVMKEVKGKEGIKVYSGNFQVWPMNDKDGRISEWRGRTEIILESTDFEAASKLAAQVSDRMPIVNLDFFVAPQERAKHEAELLQEAATAFRYRAADLAKAFGYESYSIREIQLGGAGASYQPEGHRMMAMAAADAVASVPLEGGTENISLSVQGTIFLNSSKK
ncbi:SIMPL domain-containing protein [Achromobacter sp. F4_2707]|uniref:SIMPL domain-containing protein n=1 Tax=Achromobacter sp. F4_2707 TaxID=3114286 RepID=UPI0039C72278